MRYASCHFIWKLQHTALCDFSGYCDTVMTRMHQYDHRPHGLHYMPITLRILKGTQRIAVCLDAMNQDL